MKPDYLFIAGCARSGTSALAQLLGSHGKAVMGMERFGHLVGKDDFRLRPAHFEPERFLHVQPGDTFYDDFGQFHQWDPQIVQKVQGGQLAYIGDKRPELYESYDALFAQFPSAKVIFIYRNINDVAASWNKRAADGENWPAHRDFKKAVFVWNNSLRATRDAIDKYTGKIVCLRYEDVFLEAKDLGNLYRWLGLDMDRTTQEKLKNILNNSRRLQEERQTFALSQEQRAFCEQHADFKREKALDALRIVK